MLNKCLSFICTKPNYTEIVEFFCFFFSLKPLFFLHFTRDSKVINTKVNLTDCFNYVLYLQLTKIPWHVFIVFMTTHAKQKLIWIEMNTSKHSNNVMFCFFFAGCYLFTFIKFPVAVLISILVSTMLTFYEHFVYN